MVSIRLQKYNNARVYELKKRRSYILQWLAEYDKISNLTKHADSIVLAKLVVEHLNEYINAYETSDFSKIIHSTLKDAAILKVAREILY